jgi:hypothetical protein
MSEFYDEQRTRTPRAPAGEAEAREAGRKEIMEQDRRQLVEALGIHVGTPWGEAIEEVARLREEHRRFRSTLVQIVGVSAVTSEGILAADSLGRAS